MSPLDHIQSREPCEEAASPLLPFERHAFTLSRFLQESDFGTRLPNAFEVGEPLILAAGLTHVSIITNGLDDQNGLCSNICAESRGPAASAAPTELIRTPFVWGATELATPHALRWRQYTESDPKRLCRLVD